MKNQPTKFPYANKNIVLREEFDDWAILFDPDTGNAFGLNPVSVIIWKRLDGRHNIKDIVKEIQTKCENVPEDVEQHVKDYIKQLVDKGFAGFEA